VSERRAAAAEAAALFPLIRKVTVYGDLSLDLWCTVWRRGW